jgi:hypothetical protein
LVEVGYDFFTICDRAYAPQALSLYRSLEAVSLEFRLRVFCIDEPTKDLFERLTLPKLIAVDIRDLEQHDPDLAEVRSDRTRAEYCWTAKASAGLYTFEREPDVELLTYVDSDLMFFDDPSALFEEFAEGSILLVPHRNPAAVRWWDDWGIYNAGFVSFRRGDVASAALRWWRERCLEWCYARLEQGKYADQTYLDYWPDRFAGTQVLEHPGGGLAPWNVTESAVEQRRDKVTVDGLILVFFHYATLRIFSDRPTVRRLGLLPSAFHVTGEDPPLLWSIDRSYAPITSEAKRLLWDPYLNCVAAAHDQIRRISPASRFDLPRLGLGTMLARAAPHTAVGLTRRVSGRARELLTRR